MKIMKVYWKLEVMDCGEIKEITDFDYCKVSTEDISLNNTKELPKFKN